MRFVHLSVTILERYCSIDGVFGVLGANINQSILVVCYCRWVVNLIETHHVWDDLLINISLVIAFDQVHQNVDRPTSLVTKYLASCDVVCCHNIGRLVLLNITELSTCFLELSIKDVHKCSIEAHKYPNHSRLFVDLLIWQCPENSIKEVIHLCLGHLLGLATPFIQ